MYWFRNRGSAVDFFIFWVIFFNGDKMEYPPPKSIFSCTHFCPCPKFNLADLLTGSLLEKFDKLNFNAGVFSQSPPPHHWKEYG